ncbi:hypothetical protein GJAV_G00188640 [Gymnothorax javanicus]|nr:hypothetical protein GJAV_G00188640 [Gymnothorax javanicus]
MSLWQLLCEPMQRKRRMRTSGVLQTWVEAVENMRRAEISTHRSLKIRCWQEWQSRAAFGATVRLGVAALEDRACGVLRSAFSLSRERRRYVKQRLLGKAGTVDRHWRQRTLRTRPRD